MNLPERAKTLEERVTDKLHESIGDLLTPDDLRKIVERGVEQFLFRPRQVKDGYGYAKTEEPIAKTLVSKHYAEQAQKAVQDWIESNPEVLKDAVQKFLAQGVGRAVLAELERQFDNKIGYAMQYVENSFAKKS